MTEKPKLIEHRKAENVDAYTFELRDENIERLVKTLIPHLRNAERGYPLDSGTYYIL